ncbi:hypothetical protein J1614_009123, partial [Plenodomus biglobosus]
YEPALSELSPHLSTQHSLQQQRASLVATESAFLLQISIRIVAKWTVIFDHTITYQRVVTRLCPWSPLMFHSVRAFTANQLALSNDISAQSLVIERANFWVDIRHEIVVAMTNEQPLIPVPLDWAISWKGNESGEDVLGNHVLWILAGAINLPYLWTT